MAKVQIPDGREYLSGIHALKSIRSAAVPDNRLIMSGKFFLSVYTLFKILMPVLVGTFASVVLVVYENRKTGKKTPVGLIIGKIVLGLTVGFVYLQYGRWLSAKISDVPEAHMAITFIVAFFSEQWIYIVKYKIDKFRRK